MNEERKFFIKLKKFSLIFNYYMIFDTNENVLAKCLLQNDITFAYTHHFISDSTEYTIQVCRISKWQKKKFLEAILQLPMYMKIHGHSDYEDFCVNFIENINEIS